MIFSQFVFISIKEQQLYCYEDDNFYRAFNVSTAKKGVGEQMNSECTPRGWHRVHSCIGMGLAENSVLVSRQWTGEIFSRELAANNPARDWILTRIIQIDGLERGRNKGGQVDSLQRYIYLHGTPDSTQMDKPGSHGCIRLQNADIIDFANWISIGTRVCIE